MQLLIGTNNPGKLEQIQTGLQVLQIECVSPKQIGIEADIEETGNSYQENALLKAQFYHQQSGLPTLTDDSGLEVGALPDLLGVHSRRLDKQTALNDEEWVQQFLALMQNVVDRSAMFTCTMCYLAPNVTPQFFTADLKGSIAYGLEYPYKKGLPAASLFIPNGEALTYSQLEVESEQFDNHRTKALKQLIDYLS